MRPGGAGWAVSVDSTVVRAHQHAAGARRALPADLGRGAAANDKNPAPASPGREGPGRSRPGLATKIHLVAGRRCRPLARITTPGQHGDCPQFIPLMNKIRIRRRGKGRPRTRPGAALADKAYSSRANRAYLRKRGIKAVIPVKEDQETTAARTAGRAAARLQRRLAQGPQHRRAVPEQAQAAPGRRDQVRPARPHLPGHHQHLPGHHQRRIDQDLAPGSRPMIQETAPSRQARRAGAGCRGSTGGRHSHRRPPQPTGRRRRPPPDRRMPPLHRRLRGSAGTQHRPGRAHRPDDGGLPGPRQPRVPCVPLARLQDGCSAS